MSRMQLDLKGLRRTARRRPFLDMTPLIDMVFNLLIFFAVTTSVASSAAAMKVNLPKAEAAVRQNSSLVISLSREGRLEVGEEEISWDSLHSRLERVRKSNPDTAVIVRADKGVIYEGVVRILDEVKQAGLNDLSLAVVKERDR